MSGFDHFEGLFGNEQLKNYLNSGISSEKLPHALIFDGAEGSGKKTAAIMTASALEPDYSDKIRRMISPDVTLHTTEEGKKSIGVSLIRSIREAAYITPQELSIRVFIISGAHTMTVEAQNALLKILEEPPGKVYFFLLCENASALLPTVRSRAPVLRMQSFADGELTEYLVSHDDKAKRLFERDPEAFGTLIRASEGTIGGALKRLGSSGSDAQKLRKRVSELLELLSGGIRAEVTLFFVSGMYTRDELDTLMLFLSLSVRDMLTVKYGINTDTVYFTHYEEAAAISAQFARDTLMKTYTCADKMRGYLTANVNPQLFSLRAADMLCEALK